MPASRPPAPPSRCPVIDFVELTGIFFGAFAENALDGNGFDDIADRRGSAMRVHVADIIRREFRVFQRGAHDAIGAIAIFGRLRDVISIAGHAVADDFSKDRRHRAFVRVRATRE